MTNTNSKQAGAIARFRTLHESGCFLLPNPWDVGTALYLQHLGFSALATTSSGYAFARGLPDTVSALQLDDVITHFRDIAIATSLPVNADFQSGYAHDPEGVAANVARCIETGIAGLSIEDATGNDAMPLYEPKLAIERIRAARTAIDAASNQVVLTARCEAWLTGEADPLHVALDRLVAFADAGADCLYAPGVSDPAEIATIVRAVSPKPVNILISRPNPELTMSRLADLGVRRVSVGSALARVAWGAFMRAARNLAEEDSFDAFTDAAPFTELNDLFRKRG
ncbi:MAG: hypothetical protein QOD75_3876 [Blastocatellia bacterium]|jgi:2-methylisocitrate lyase-like PEP mutase family enzyme|nr:hypothetical protein [Blastocatellia bacterium]